MGLMDRVGKEIDRLLGRYDHNRVAYGETEEEALEEAEEKLPYPLDSEGAFERIRILDPVEVEGREEQMYKAEIMYDLREQAEMETEDVESTTREESVGTPENKAQEKRKKSSSFGAEAEDDFEATRRILGE